jgi:hypothetical protein
LELLKRNRCQTLSAFAFFTAVFGRTFFQVLGMFFAIGTSSTPWQPDLALATGVAVLSQELRFHAAKDRLPAVQDENFLGSFDLLSPAGAAQVFPKATRSCSCPCNQAGNQAGRPSLS